MYRLVGGRKLGFLDPTFLSIVAHLALGERFDRSTTSSLSRSVDWRGCTLPIFHLVLGGRLHCCTASC